MFVNNAMNRCPVLLIMIKFNMGERQGLKSKLLVQRLKFRISNGSSIDIVTVTWMWHNVFEIV